MRGTARPSLNDVEAPERCLRDISVSGDGVLAFVRFLGLCEPEDMLNAMAKFGSEVRGRLKGGELL